MFFSSEGPILSHTYLRIIGEESVKAYPPHLLDAGNLADGRNCTSLTFPLSPRTRTSTTSHPWSAEAVRVFRISVSVNV